MKPTRVSLGCVMMAFLLLPIAPVSGDVSKPRTRDDEASVWMTKKLEFSQKILQGLTKGDFEMVRKNADSMIVVGYLEKSDRAGLAEYKKQLQAFEAANKELVRQAEKKNSRAATKAYAQLVVSCVECHDLLRDRKSK